MISNQVLQNTIDELKSISNREMAVLDLDGHTTVKTFRDDSVDPTGVVMFAASSEDTAQVSGFELFRVKDEGEDEYILAVKGTGNEDRLVGRMAKYQLEMLLTAYKERYDKDNFIKSLLMDNLMLVDIFSRAKKLHIELEARRCVFIVELADKNQDEAIITIKNIFAGNTSDFITAIDRKSIVVVKELEEDDGYEQLSDIAKKIALSLKNDIGENARISYGTIVGEIKEVSRSYKEAKMAQDVGRIFFEERQINAYTELGIGRLIYQLPLPLCKMFLKEIFGKNQPSELDEETITTINKFFENSLNVSETSRQLYIHRNTLVYRLDKIQKLTGLDLRVFDDAITFKIALMVSKYMQHIEKIEYNK